MFGLTLEKLIVVVVVAAIVIGPQRLPLYAERFAEFIRGFRDFTEVAKTRAEHELGVPLDTAEWSTRLQQYDPRRIVREALARDERTAQGVVPGSAATGEGTDTDMLAPVEEIPESEAGAQGDDSDPHLVTRERWLVVGGSSGHPRRRKVVEQFPSETPTAPGNEAHQDYEQSEAAYS